MATRGCLITKASDQTGINYGGNWTIIPWDTETYDPDGCHSGSSSKIIIPAAYNGRYGVFTSFYNIVNSGAHTWQGCKHTKNGTDPAGAGIFGVDAQNGNGQNGLHYWMTNVSTPQLLTTGDEWESLILPYNDNSVTVKSHSSFGLYVFDNAHVAHRCVAQTTNQTSQNFSSPAVIAFDGTDVEDTDAIHDPSSNNTKLIIPSALNGMRGVVYAQVWTTNDTAGQFYSLAIRKGGSVAWVGMGGLCGKERNDTSHFYATQTQVIPFATGEEYEALLYTNADSSISLTGANTRIALWAYG